MQVKKFEAPTLQEALDHVKRELGPEAIILQTKTHKRGFGLMSKGSVEITAAVSERAISRKRVTESKLPENVREKVDRLPAAEQAKVFEKGMDAHLRSALQKSGSDRVELGKGGAVSRRQAAPGAGAIAAGSPQVVPRLAPNHQAAGIQTGAPRREVRYAEIDAPREPDPALRGEVEELKRMIHELKQAQEEALSQASQSPQGVGARSALQGSLTTPALQDLFEQLTLAGVDKRVALGVVRKVQFEVGEGAESADAVLDASAQELMRMVAVGNPLASIMARGASPGGAGAPALLALVGPTGVGKTTTLAKIAAEATLRRGLKVGLINLDSYRVAAFDQLATYAKLLGVPFRSAHSAEDLQAAIADFQSLDLVLLDTTGRSPKDPDSLREMNELLGRLPQVRSFLVVSATTRDTELLETAQRFSVFRPEGLVFSKLDEASVYGSILNLAGRTKLPLCFFTTGQRVPEDLEEATPERLASLVLDLH
jgi:flagellar biosynthesis protein FlhF